MKELSNKRVLDAKALFERRRYQGCVYMAGYTIELLLKYNVCSIFRFYRGFPESKSDFNSYSSRIKKTFQNASSLKKFKTHNLNELLDISGKIFDVKQKSLNEWTTLLTWSPEQRYINNKISKIIAEDFLNSVNKVRNILLN